MNDAAFPLWKAPLDGKTSLDHGCAVPSQIDPSVKIPPKPLTVCVLLVCCSTVETAAKSASVQRIVPEIFAEPVAAFT